MRKPILCVIALSILMSSCATVFTGSRQRVVIDSNVPESTVRIDGEKRGVTPLAIKLKKGFTGQTIQVTKDGYSTESITPEMDFNAVAVLNLLSILGWGIDAATGSMMKYDRKAYNFELKAISPITPLSQTPAPVKTQK